MSETAQIEKKEQFGPPTITAKASRWQVELAAAKKDQEDFWKEGDKVVQEYLGRRAESSLKRLNLYYSDVQTIDAFLSGEPKARVRRRNADANDDEARVSAEILERMLNTDLERDTDNYRKALQLAKGDWLKPGLGWVRLRYVTGATEKVPGKPEQKDATGAVVAPEVPETERKPNEDVETDHGHWRDVRWSPCRTWNEMRWRAYRWEMTVPDAEKRWGEKVAKKLPRTSKVDSKDDEGKPQDAWQRIEGWEIWDKTERKRLQYVDGYPDILEEEDDPLGLPGFFPEPEPLVANNTTSKWMPRSGYFLVESLYEEAHELSTRIRNLVRAAKIRGAYDASNPELQRLFDEASETDMVGVQNWAAFIGKGGIEGAFQMVPLKDIVEAINLLVVQRNMVRQEIAEVLGISDITRGQSAERVTATTDRIKARAFSTRQKPPQDELARFSSEALRIRAHIIAKFFDAETIVRRSNIEQSELIDQPAPPAMPGMPPGPPQKVPNRPLIDKAVALIKQDISQYRITIDAESLAVTDLDTIQQEAMSFLEGTAKYFTAVGPLAASPDLMEFFAAIYQQAIATMRGAQRFEPIVDRFIAKMQAAAAAPKPPPPPDPKVEQEKIKTEAIRMKAETDKQKAGMDMQAKVLDLQVKKAELGMKGQEMAMDLQAKQADHALQREGMEMDREARMQDHAMAAEERQEEHAMHKESMRMGMEAEEASAKHKMAMLKAKPKGKGDGKG